MFAVVVVLIVGVVVMSGESFWLPVLGVVLAILGADLIISRRGVCPVVAREVPAHLAVNVVAEVVLKISLEDGSPVVLQVYDELPERCELADGGMPRKLKIKPNERVEVRYGFIPLRRGDATFGQVVMLVLSPLGLWETRRRLMSPQTVRVYPDFSIITSYLGLLSDQQTVRLGLRLTPRRGEGLEFHQLREYRTGDSVRQIDWKASARRQSLISREYQEERDQRVLFLIDSGRRMRARDGRLSHFDYALNAMLLLAYIALRQGDSVALKVFGHDRKWIPPQRGVASVNLLLNESYDLHTGTEAADYLSAAEEVMTQQRKRSLVILLTNLREEDDDLAPALALLRKRHVVLLANLREQILDENAEHMPQNFDAALRVAGTHAYLAARRQHQASCQALAHLLIDCTPEELPVSVVNAYWQVKRSGAL